MSRTRKTCIAARTQSRADPPGNRPELLRSYPRTRTNPKRKSGPGAAFEPALDCPSGIFRRAVRYGLALKSRVTYS